MNIRSIYVLLATIVAVFSSCQPGKKAGINQRLIGEWVLEQRKDDYAVDAPDKIVFEKQNRVVIEYKDENHEDTMVYDAASYISEKITLTESGQYFILENRRRDAVTISLIPDSKIDFNQMIKPRCWNFDLVFLNNHKLELAEATSYENRFFETSSPGITTYTRIYTYKRKE